LWKKIGSTIDGGLHFLFSDIDAFKSRLNCRVMIELPKELVEVNLVQAGNLAKLAFERGGDGGRP